MAEALSLRDQAVSDVAALEALPPLRDVIARHGFSARKALGQHFLLDLNLTRRIAGPGARSPEATWRRSGQGRAG